MSDESDPELDVTAARLLSKGDVFVFSMGWLWSIQGLIFTAFCAMGVIGGIDVVNQYLHREPVRIERYQDLLNVPNHRVVTFRGTINGDELIEFESKILKKAFSIVTLKNTDRKVLLFVDGILSNDQKSGEQFVDFTGKIYQEKRGEVKVRNNKFNPIALFHDKGIDVHDEIVIISLDEIPDMRTWYIGLIVLCSLGLLYIGYRLLKALRYLSNRDAFYEDILSKVD